MNMRFVHVNDMPVSCTMNLNLLTGNGHSDIDICRAMTVIAPAKLLTAHVI